MSSAANNTVQLVSALEAAAAREARAGAALVSVTIEIVAQGDGDKAETQLLRKTRTLIFMRAELRTASGALIATANSVHKLEG